MVLKNGSEDSESTVKLLDLKGVKSYFFGTETAMQLDYNMQALNQAKKKLPKLTQYYQRHHMNKVW